VYFGRVSHIPGAWSSWRVHFVRWRLMFAAWLHFSSYTQKCVSSQGSSWKRRITVGFTGHIRTVSPQYGTALCPPAGF
jgi:hypothetical protein